VAFLSAAAASIFLIAPSTYHRIRFRDGDKERMLLTSNRLLLAGTGCMAVAIITVGFLIGEHLYGFVVGIIAAIVIGLMLAWFWYGLALRRKMDDNASGRSTQKG
jgi:ABC-type bacteriocin/lantibiotic exporter with double-glycine peptidase domain